MQALDIAEGKIESASQPVRQTNPLKQIMTVRGPVAKKNPTNLKM